MGSRKKNTLLGLILSYSFKGIVALSFVASAIYGVLSIEPSEARVMAILAIVLIAFFIAVNKSNKKHWEKVIEEKEREIRKLQEEKFKQYHRMNDEIKELKRKK